MSVSANEVKRGKEESKMLPLSFYIKMIVIWVMKPCSLVVTYIAGMCCLFKIKSYPENEGSTSH